MHGSFFDSTGNDQMISSGLGSRWRYRGLAAAFVALAMWPAQIDCQRRVAIVQPKA